MPLFNVYSGSGQTFSLDSREPADSAHEALADTIDIDNWTPEIESEKDSIGPGEIVRDKSGREWFAVRVN